MAKLLIVDDEKNICALIGKYASSKGHSFDFAYNGQEAVTKCEHIDYDIIIMDIMMPVLNGYQAIEEIRAFSNTPIIVLTAKAEEYDKEKAFNLGIDDYVVKPFSIKELMFRINAILKRVNKYKSDSVIIGDLKLDFLAYKVTIGNELIELSPKEMALLFYLVNNANRVCTREAIIEEIWGFDYEGNDRTIDTHIKLIRKKLNEYGSMIKTVKNVGYRFDQEIK